MFRSTRSYSSTFLTRNTLGLFSVQSNIVSFQQDGNNQHPSFTNPSPQGAKRERQLSSLPSKSNLPFDGSASLLSVTDDDDLTFRATGLIRRTPVLLAQKKKPKSTNKQQPSRKVKSKTDAKRQVPREVKALPEAAVASESLNTAEEKQGEDKSLLEKKQQLKPLLEYVMSLLSRALIAWETQAVKDMIGKRRNGGSKEGESVTFPPFKNGVLDYAKGLLEDDLSLLVWDVKAQDWGLRNRIEDVRQVFDAYVHSPICLINTVYSLCERIVPEERPNILDFLEDKYFGKMDHNTNFDEVQKVMDMSLKVCISFVNAQLGKFIEAHMEEVQRILLSPHRCKGMSLSALSKKLKKKPRREMTVSEEENRRLYPDDSRFPFLDGTQSTEKEIGHPCEATLLNKM